eukprot:3529400-Rhodomonas_salina.1
MSYDFTPTCSPSAPRHPTPLLSPPTHHLITHHLITLSTSSLSARDHYQHVITQCHHAIRRYCILR